MNSVVEQGFVRWTSSHWTLPGICNAFHLYHQTPSREQLVNDTLIEFSPVWTDLPDVKVQCYPSIGHCGQHPPVEEPKFPWSYTSMKLVVLSGDKPFLCTYWLAAVSWTVMLTEVVSLSQRKTMAKGTSISFWNRIPWIFWCPWWSCHCMFPELWHPLWQEAGGCYPWGGRLGQELDCW